MIILNEKEYVEQILTDPDLETSKTYQFLNLYAKYLYQEKHLKKTEIQTKLDAFMTNHYPRYNPVDWISSLEKCTNKADKYPLCKCCGIWITEQELSKIETLKDKVLERLAFTLLCLAKFSNFRNPNNNNWVSYSNGEIYSMACINTPAIEKDRKLYLLKEQGFLAFAKKINNLHIQVQYLEETGKPKLFLFDFRKLGYEWRLYKGENYIRCANCKILTKKNSNRTKYCKDCAKIAKRKQNQAYYQKLLGN